MSLSHRALVRRRRAAALALTAIGSLLALAAPGPADAAPTDAGRPAKITATPRAGAAQTSLTPARRTALVRSAQSAAADTARRIGLGAKEKLVVKDVVTDADGTTHTRYERTFAGLPVLGGDLVVHDSRGRTTVTKANATRLSVPSLSPKVTARGATDKALAASKRDRVRDAEVGNASRLVVWAGTGKPVLAWETLVEGVQKDGTPSELQVVTDAATGKELLAAEKVHTGEGTGQYVGTVPLGTTPSGSTYQLVDPDRAGHKTYDLNQGTSGTGTLFTDDNDVWGTGLPSNRQTAGVDVAFGAAATWDFYKEAFGRNGIRNDGVAAYSRAHYGSNDVNAFWQDSCFCMTSATRRRRNPPPTRTSSPPTTTARASRSSTRCPTSPIGGSSTTAVRHTRSSTPRAPASARCRRSGPSSRGECSSTCPPSSESPGWSRVERCTPRTSSSRRRRST